MILTLTTDFGLTDHFAGVMKGVILSIAPRATIVDITHGIPPFAIRESAFAVAEAYRWFPKKTVHVVVVDPGVGTPRRPIVAEAAGQYFVAPDNGVLSLVYAREKHKVRAITAEKYFLKPVSRTFHGRDIFAPVAAHLAKGVAAAAFGKTIDDYCRSSYAEPVRTGKRTWQGAVLKIDHFGNLITNIHIAEFPVLQTRPFQLNVGQAALTALAGTFGDAAAGEPALIVGSSGYLEVAVNQDSAARRLNVAAGAPVDLTLW
jgi:S-adenosylmethionine hydrolase